MSEDAVRGCSSDTRKYNGNTVCYRGSQWTPMIRELRGCLPECDGCEKQTQDGRERRYI